MTKKKEFHCRFHISTLNAAFEKLQSCAQGTVYSSGGVVIRSAEDWIYDTLNECFVEYVTSGWQSLYVQQNIGGTSLAVDARKTYTLISVSGPSREVIQEIFSEFEKCVLTATPLTIEPTLVPPSRIFIGHGRSMQWRDLKDHLQDQHGYDVEAYEVGARAGHAIRDILDEMLNVSGFAILVLTAEDETADGTLRARQNVVHELGLFQGRLGFAKAIALVQKGVEVFTNLNGIHYLGFDSISETYGHVVATINREARRSAR